VRAAAGERTELAWERSALGPLAAAALLLFHHVGPTLGRVLLVAADVLLALVIIWFGRRRDRRIRSAAVAATAIALGTAVVLAFGT
jgi:uncharacterized membrane protein YidH (DUF202 family)